MLTSRPVQLMEVAPAPTAQELYEAFVSRYFNKPISVLRAECEALEAAYVEPEEIWA